MARHGYRRARIEVCSDEIDEGAAATKWRVCSSYGVAVPNCRAATIAFVRVVCRHPAQGGGLTSAGRNRIAPGPLNSRWQRRCAGYSSDVFRRVERKPFMRMSASRRVTPVLAWLTQPCGKVASCDVTHTIELPECRHQPGRAPLRPCCVHSLHIRERCSCARAPCCMELRLIPDPQIGLVDAKTASAWCNWTIPVMADDGQSCGLRP